ncbi:MAG TPA: hypothetical protein VJU84_08760 [Pyrinomonadaceae bacterium]|nr:hypothetical protein [Pyrinomonadaceae bacterium]
MIARTLLTTENIGREVLIWPPQTGAETVRCMQGKIKAWSADHERIFVELKKDYGKGRRAGEVLQVDRDICSFRQADTGDESRG